MKNSASQDIGPAALYNVVPSDSPDSLQLLHSNAYAATDSLDREGEHSIPYNEIVVRSMCVILHFRVRASFCMNSLCVLLFFFFYYCGAFIVFTLVETVEMQV